MSVTPFKWSKVATAIDPNWAFKTTRKRPHSAKTASRRRPSRGVLRPESAGHAGKLTRIAELDDRADMNGALAKSVQEVADATLAFKTRSRSVKSFPTARRTRKKAPLRRCKSARKVRPGRQAPAKRPRGLLAVDEGMREASARECVLTKWDFTHGRTRLEGVLETLNRQLKKETFRHKRTLTQEKRFKQKLHQLDAEVKNLLHASISQGKVEKLLLYSRQSLISLCSRENKRLREELAKLEDDIFAARNDRRSRLVENLHAKIRSYQHLAERLANMVELNKADCLRKEGTEPDAVEQYRLARELHTAEREIERAFCFRDKIAANLGVFNEALATTRESTKRCAGKHRELSALAHRIVALLDRFHMKTSREELAVVRTRLTSLEDSLSTRLATFSNLRTIAARLGRDLFFRAPVSPPPEQEAPSLPQLEKSILEKSILEKPSEELASDDVSTSPESEPINNPPVSSAIQIRLMESKSASFTLHPRFANGVMGRIKKMFPNKDLLVMRTWFGDKLDGFFGTVGMPDSYQQKFMRSILNELPPMCKDSLLENLEPILEAAVETLEEITTADEYPAATQAQEEWEAMLASAAATLRVLKDHSEILTPNLTNLFAEGRAQSPNRTQDRPQSAGRESEDSGPVTLNWVNDGINYKLQEQDLIAIVLRSWKAADRLQNKCREFWNLLKFHDPVAATTLGNKILSETTLGFKLLKLYDQALNKLAKKAPDLPKLAASHRARGATQTCFNSAGLCMLEVLQKCLGQRWNNRTAYAWVWALENLNHMLGDQPNRNRKGDHTQKDRLTFRMRDVVEKK